MAVAHRTESAAEIRAAVGTTVTQRTVTNTLLQEQLRARRPVACIPLTPNQPLATRRPGENLQPTCLRPRHTGPTPGVMVWGAISYDSRGTLVVIPRTLIANLYGSLVIQPVVRPFMNSIQGGVLQQDNARRHTAVVTEHALQSVNMLSWPARSFSNRASMKHHWTTTPASPQPALAIPVLTDQVQQAWNFIPQTDIRHLHDTMHARLHACIQNSGGYTRY
ncbi:hypothetical protein AVEN_267340-1 [Araneus ventricosus]|uniref:Tc1-like transposase DDE domain-containing protein n=1 Tax=Araneus ventricosus TaxID=182803 RepID=A0A4Y2DMR6_ARAVE|nr:hypothetical protein AVEN_267340-1 [Araneus ventricosus]